MMRGSSRSWEVSEEEVERTRRRLEDVNYWRHVAGWYDDDDTYVTSYANDDYSSSKSNKVHLFPPFLFKVACVCLSMFMCVVAIKVIRQRTAAVVREHEKANFGPSSSGSYKLNKKQSPHRGRSSSSSRGLGARRKSSSRSRSRTRTQKDDGDDENGYKLMADKGSGSGSGRRSRSRSTNKRGGGTTLSRSRSKNRQEKDTPPPPPPPPPTPPRTEMLV